MRYATGRGRRVRGRLTAEVPLGSGCYTRVTCVNFHGGFDRHTTRKALFHRGFVEVQILSPRPEIKALQAMLVRPFPFGADFLPQGLLRKTDGFRGSRGELSAGAKHPCRFVLWVCGHRSVPTQAVR